MESDFMKVMWLCNTPLYKIGKKIGYVSYTESWLNAIAEELLKDSNIKLIVTFPQQLSNKLLKGRIGQLTYYGFYRKKINAYQPDAKIINYMKNIIDFETPDIIHIFGTEYVHSLEMLQVAPKSRTIISIQGLVSICKKHYADGIPITELFKGHRNRYRWSSIASEIKDFHLRGKNEINSIKQCNNIIGRTHWDNICVKNINPLLKYFHCNETMRKEFYSKNWTLDKIDRFSILVSQANYPVKGLHYMIEAMAIIHKKYPQCRVYITGNSDFIINDEKTSYGAYCHKLITKYNLKECFKFIGYHSAKNMCNRYLKSHVVVLCSNIENSPNCIGEAMLLGVPVVASFVGGVPDLLQHGKEGYLYQHNAPYMLAGYIEKIFSNDTLALKFSHNAREKAKFLYDRDLNQKNLLDIYHEMINN